MAHKELKELIAGYALGALDEEELVRLEKHLEEGCETCQELLIETEEVLALLPYSLPNFPLPPGIKRKIFERIEELETGKIEAHEVERKYFPPPKTGITPLWFKLGGAVALLLLLFLLVSNLALKQRLSEQQKQLTSLQKEFAQQAEVLEFLRSPDVRVTNLSGLTPSPKAYAKVLWSPVENKSFFHAFNLPPPPPKKTYQLWVISGSEPISAGVFSVDEKGDGFLWWKPSPEAQKFDKFAVTLEPEGGLPKPSGEMYLLGPS